MKTLSTLLTAAVLFLPGPLHAASTLQFEKPQYEVNEVQGSLTILVTRTEPFLTNASVRVIVEGGTAKEGEDFKVASTINSTTNGGWFLYTTLTDLDDGVHEEDETVTLALVEPSAGLEIGAIGKTAIVIHNGKPTVMLRLSDDPKMEVLEQQDRSYGRIPENFGANRPLFEVVRLGDRDAAITVDLSLSGELDDLSLVVGEFGDFNGVQLRGRPLLNARPEVDFAAPLTRIELAPGETSRLVSAAILDDGEVEVAGETRYLAARLVNPSPGVSVTGNNVVLVGIVNNETPANLDVGPDPLEEPMVLFDWPVSEINFLNLPSGGKLVFGPFSRINGVRRVGVARLDTNNELDESFALLPELTNNPVQCVHLRSGDFLVVGDDGSLIRFGTNGARDENFQPPFGPGYKSVTEATNDAIWCVWNYHVLKLANDGKLLSTLDFGNARGAIVGVQADGGI